MTIISPYIHIFFVMLVIMHLTFKRVLIAIMMSILNFASFELGSWGIIKVLLLDLILIFTLYKTIRGRKGQTAKPNPRVASSKSTEDAFPSGFWALFDSDSNDNCSDYSGGSFDGGGDDGGGGRD